MTLSKHLAILMVSFVAGVADASWAAQQESATAKEVVQKVGEVVRYLSQSGKVSLSKLRDKDSGYVWKDSYVVVQDCRLGIVLAHSITPVLEGRDIATLIDKNGTTFAQEICTKGQQAQGGWIEYYWPRPGENEPSRKLAYAKGVEGTPYVVTAGIYDDRIALEELQNMAGQQ